MVNWLKKGKASTKALAKAKEETVERKKRQEVENLGRRFWLEPGEDRKITFLDGNLQSNGLLEFYSYREHSVKYRGKWGNHFVCLEVDGDENCPLCESGDNPSYVGVFSIIDHSTYISKAKKKYTNQRKLYVAKEGTLDKLQKLATKYKGLRGVVIDVSRTGDTMARVGDSFMYDKKMTNAQLKAKKKWLTAPLDYEKVIQYKTAKELSKMGFGKSDPDEIDDADDDIDDDDIPF